MDASYKIQRGIDVHLIQFFMCPEFWVHIKEILRFYNAEMQFVSEPGEFEVFVGFDSTTENKSSFVLVG